MWVHHEGPEVWVHYEGPEVWVHHEGPELRVHHEGPRKKYLTLENSITGENHVFHPALFMHIAHTGPVPSTYFTLMKNLNVSETSYKIKQTDKGLKFSYHVLLLISNIRLSQF